MARDDVLGSAQRLARAYLDGVGQRSVGASDPVGLRRPLRDDGEDPLVVLEELAADADSGIVASAGPRYFGFVVGGALPVSVGADWLVSAWDQMGGMYSSSPAVAVAEEVVASWVLELLGLPGDAGVGFATGAQMANFSCLAAARTALLRRVGWDVEAQGLFGAPLIHVLVGEEAHATVLARRSPQASTESFSAAPHTLGERHAASPGTISVPQVRASRKHPLRRRALFDQLPKPHGRRCLRGSAGSERDPERPKEAVADHPSDSESVHVYVDA